MNTKKQSKKQENRIAKEINAKVTIASGALDFQKADVRNDEFLIEAKTTAKDFYSLNVKTWEKIKDQAIKDGLRIPLMCVDLEDGKHSIAILNSLDLWGLFNEVIDEEKNKYVGNPIPTEAQKSFRLKADFLYEDFPQNIKNCNFFIRRMDLHLGNNKLSCIEWKDLLFLLDQRERFSTYEIIGVDLAKGEDKTVILERRL